MSGGIAIVGMACRYPGARSPGELWENVLAGRREFRRIPPERMPPGPGPGAGPADPDGTYLRHGAFLTDYDFDRAVFRVSGDTYRSADLTHWLALDVAARALHDAGFPEGEGLPRERTGVLVGNSLTGEQSRANMLRLRWPYVAAVAEEVLSEEGVSGERLDDLLGRMEDRFKAPFPEMSEESLAGALSNTIAGRICNHFDLGGGGYTVDGACASSLLSVAHGCSALRARELDAAVAGGVDVSLDPLELVGFARVGALARDEMRVFDAHPEGFWPGEGSGMVVLMREEDARDAGRPIHAVIRGWGISSDGSGGLTRPEVEGQLRAIRNAYARAGYGIGSVGYVEGHGTGTPVGDETELRSLSAALRKAGVDQPVAVGSIKANIGHTKAAAGVAGLIKATLAAGAGVLPPTTGVRTPHPLLGERPRVLRVLDRGGEWPVADGAPARRAGVNSFGFGGINVHVTLEGPRAVASGTRRGSPPPRASETLLRSPQDHELLLLAAPTRAELAGRLRSLAEMAGGLSRSELVDLARRLWVEEPADREERSHRAALVVETPGELAAAAGALFRASEEPVTSGGWREVRTEGSGRAFLGAPTGEPSIGFLFPGQGGDVPRSAGALGRRFGFVERIVESALERDESDDGGEGGVATRMAQPAVVAASVAGLDLLGRLGLEGRVGVGHSLGELTALHWGGALDAEQVLRLAAARGRLMEDVSPGTMASLSVGRDEAERLLEELWESGETAAGKLEAVRIAGHNAPDRTVVSGPASGVEALIAGARSAGVPAVRLPVDRAFHTPVFDGAARAFGELVGEEPVGPLCGRVISTTTGEPLGGSVDVARLLAEQIVSPVRFVEAVAAAEAEGVDLWIEVGPGRSLSALVRRGAGAPAFSLGVGDASLRAALVALAAAHAAGADVDGAPLFENRFHRPFDPEHRPRFLVNPCAVAGPVHGVPAPAGRGREASGGAHAPEAPEDARSAGSAAAEDPATLLRRLVAEKTELPASGIEDDDHFLADLHLNSIAVAGIVGKAARLLGVAAFEDPTAFADATVADAVEGLRARLEKGTKPGSGSETDASDGPGGERTRSPGRRNPGPPPGVDPWVRPFGVEWVRAPSPPSRAPRESTAGPWRVLGDGGGLASHLRDALAERAPGGGVAVCLGMELDAEAVVRLLDTARALSGAGSEPGAGSIRGEAASEDPTGGPGPRLLLVHRGSGGESFARSLHLERPDVAVRCVALPADVLPARGAAWAAAEVPGATGFGAVRYDRDGRRHEPRLRPLPQRPDAADRELPGPEDVVLVSGGGKGITAECALALARRTGARLALLGRSDPADDEELAHNLGRFRDAGVTHEYVRCDVTDRRSTEGAVEEARRRLGEPTVLLHGAGRNVPRRIPDLDGETVLGTAAPKVRGLENLVSVLDPERLRTVVAFGSILSRTGMCGNADYALANEWLRRCVDALGAERPGCRCLTVEWSVWSGAGMGERLGRIRALAAEGVDAIPVAEGVEAFLALLTRPDAPSSTVVTGRFGSMPTVQVAGDELPLLRFLERPRVRVPGVELVVDAEVDVGSDPYLADHALDGEPILPAVMALEAMAQAAAATIDGLLAGRNGADGGTALAGGIVFEDVELARPITVSGTSPRTIRLATLVVGRNELRVVIRSDETDFSVDHVRARCHFIGTEAESREVAGPGDAPEGPLPLSPDRDLYGSLLFQDGRFRRLRRYRRLNARAFVAELDGDDGVRWFGRFHPRTLLLGDPGLRDAALHGIQACIPHRRVLPVGVDRIVIPGPLGSSGATARARERIEEAESGGRAFTYDLTVRGFGDRNAESWRGLRLRAIGPAEAPDAWPVPLLGPYVERTAAGALGRAGVRVGVAEGDDAAGLAARLLGRDVELGRRTDGAPLLDGEERISVSHCRGLTLVVVEAGAGGGSGVGCDLEAIRERSPEEWRDVLGAARLGLARRVAEASGEPLMGAATRVWTAVESVKKARGDGTAVPELVDVSGEGRVVFTAAGLTVTTLRVRATGAGRDLVLAVAAAPADAVRRARPGDLEAAAGRAE